MKASSMEEKKNKQQGEHQAIKREKKIV